MNQTPMAVVMGDRDSVHRVFGARRLELLAARTTLLPEIVTPADWPAAASKMSDVEVIFGTWSLPAFTLEDAALLPKLRAVFYAAGSVRYFAPPLLDHGVEIFSSASANAIPVAEFTLAQILLATKGYFRNTRAIRSPDGHRSAFRGRGNFGATVAVLGAGEIGRMLIERLKPCALRVIVFDPFMDTSAAERLGVEKVALDEAFARGDIVTNHLADLPETKGMLRGSHFSAMPRDATFINTGRGGTLNQADLIEVLQERPDLSALLDVTNPEPPAIDSPLYTLANVQLSSHIAGSIGDECGRMADWMLEEFGAWLAGGALKFNVTRDRLARMA